MNHYIIQRNHNIVLIMPKNINDKKLYEYDCLSGSRIIDPNKKLKFSNNNIYNSSLFEHYLRKTKDYRDVVTGSMLTLKDLNLLISQNKSNEPFEEILKEEELNLRDMRISISNYFIERCECIIENLLNDFEIEKINSSSDLNEIFINYWNDLVQSLIGVLHNNPFKIVELSTKLKLQISDAYAASIDDNASLYIHECTYLQPVFVATFSLFTLFATGLFKFDSEMDFINAVYLIKPGKIH